MPPRQAKQTGGRASSAGTRTEADDVSPVRTPRSPTRSLGKAVHLPPFQAKDVRFWFMQVEAMFRTARITSDQAKFDHVITALDITAAADIRELLETPPDEDLYATLKKALIDRLAISEAARIKRVLSNEQIGDRTPSQHYRHLMSQAGSNFSEAALKSIWLDTLPSEVKLIVAGNEDLTLEKLAAMADRIVDVSGSRRHVAAVGERPVSAVDEQISALAKQISSLSEVVKKHVSRSATAEGAPKPKQKRAKSPAPASRPDSSSNGVCWYHRKYKEKALNCSEGCTWTPAPENERAQQ